MQALIIVPRSDDLRTSLHRTGAPPLGRLRPLFDPDRRERDGEPGREPVGQSHPYAPIRGMRLARTPGVQDLVGAGAAGARRRAGDHPRSHRRRTSQRPHRRSHALGLQAIVNLKSAWGSDAAYNCAELIRFPRQGDLRRTSKIRRRGHGKPAVVWSLNPTAFGTMTGSRARCCGWSDKLRKCTGLGGHQYVRTALVGNKHKQGLRARAVSLTPCSGAGNTRSS